MTKDEIIKILEDDLKDAQEQREVWYRENEQTANWSYFDGKVKGLLTAIMRVRK